MCTGGLSYIYHEMVGLVVLLLSASLKRVFVPVIQEVVKSSCSQRSAGLFRISEYEFFFKAVQG